VHIGECLGLVGWWLVGCGASVLLRRRWRCGFGRRTIVCVKYGRRAIGCLLESNSQCGHMSLLARCVVVGRKADACSRSRTAQVIDRKQTDSSSSTPPSPLSKQVQNPSQPIPRPSILPLAHLLRRPPRLNLRLISLNLTLPYSLHKLIHLRNLLIAHLLDLLLIHPLTLPLIPFNHLRVALPLGQEAHDMHGVVNFLVRAEL
jgi:hypothetical protein